MISVIVLFVLVGILVATAVGSWVFTFTRKGRKSDNKINCRAFGTLFLIMAAICVMSFVSAYHKCPNCDYLTEAAFCQECGTEVSPTIKCPNCAKEFSATDVNKVPSFCPDCGTKVKE